MAEPAALANAVLKVAERLADQAQPGARARGDRRELLQRYCGKNDTIGFFGPLAWGRIEDAAPPLHARSGELVRSRHAHFEAWPVQALAEGLDPELRIAAGPHPERDLRAALESHPDDDVRTRGLAALDRLEAARDAVAAAPPETLRDALAALDETFVELTERDATRNPGMAYGARTLSYLDCMRDLDVTMGPALVDRHGAGAADALRGRALVQRPGERDRAAGDRGGAARRRPRAVHAGADAGDADAHAVPARGGRGGPGAARAARPGARRPRSGDDRRPRRRGVRRSRARVAVRGLPFGRRADRRARRGGARRRGLPRRRRRRARRQQPAPPGRLRAPARESG